MLKIALSVVLATTYAEWFIGTYEMRAVYPFDKTRVSPADAGEARLSEVIWNTPDGETLVLWVAEPEPGAATILYLPGNAGNLAVRAERFSYFIDWGFGVVALAYRGSSGSSGSPNEVALSRDALEVYDAIGSAILPSAGPVVLYGESLGTAVAAKIAVARAAPGIILEAPFTSFVDLGKIQYPTLDLTHVLTQLWDTSSIVGDMDEPLLVLHGIKDKLVPFEQGQTVFRLAGSSDKSLVELAGIGHTGLWTPEAITAISGFLDRIVATP